MYDKVDAYMLDIYVTETVKSNSWDRSVVVVLEHTTHDVYFPRAHTRARTHTPDIPVCSFEP